MPGERACLKLDTSLAGFEPSSDTILIVDESDMTDSDGKEVWERMVKPETHEMVLFKEMPATTSNLRYTTSTILSALWVPCLKNRVSPHSTRGP
jgi:hypothetical protein